MTGWWRNWIWSLLCPFTCSSVCELCGFYSSDIRLIRATIKKKEVHTPVDGGNKISDTATGREGWWADVRRVWPPSSLIRHNPSSGVSPPLNSTRQISEWTGIRKRLLLFIRIININDGSHDPMAESKDAPPYHCKDDIEGPIYHAVVRFWRDTCGSATACLSDASAHPSPN